MSTSDQKYYAANKDRINAKRREMYAADKVLMSKVPTAELTQIRDRCEVLEKALEWLANAAENYDSTDPDMPTYDDDITLFHSAIEAARAAIAGEVRDGGAVDDTTFMLALNRSPYDISTCMECSEPVVCLPDAMPMCDPCGKLDQGAEDGK